MNLKYLRCMVRRSASQFHQAPILFALSPVARPHGVYANPSLNQLLQHSPEPPQMIIREPSQMAV